MARLAGLEEYQARGIAAYDRAVDAHFAPYRAHPAIATLQRLRGSRRVGYNAIVEAALASAPVTWAPVVPLAPWPASLDPRWDAASLGEFARAAAAFERDTGARAFFASQAAIQSQAEASIRANLDGRLQPGWYEALRPCAGLRRFVVVPGLLDGLNSYAVRIGDTVYGVLATPAFGDGDAIAYPADPQLALLVHEFHHACMNPWVDANAGALMPAAARTFDVVRERLQALAYSNPRILLYETMVRANTLRYLRQHGEDAGFARLVDEDEGKGFPWTPELADVLTRRLKLTPAEELPAVIFKLAVVRETKLLDKQGSLDLYRELLSANPRHEGALQRMAGLVQREPQNQQAFEILANAYRASSDANALSQLIEGRVSVSPDQIERKTLLSELARTNGRGRG